MSTISPDRIRRADPLADLEPAVAPEELRERIDAIVIHDRPVPRAKPRRRRLRVALALGVATAVAAVAFAALPGEPAREAPEPGSSAASILKAAAAVAADQPEPTPLTGYRYTETLDHWKWDLPRTEEVEQRVETWIDHDWRGHRISHQGRVIQGTERTKKSYFVEPSEGKYIYGDMPAPRVAELPTESRALLDELVEDYKTGPNWAPGLPTPEQVHHDVVRNIVLLLGQPDTTPELRAALFGALALMPGVRPAPDAKDAAGRSGTAVTIPGRPDGGGGVFTVIFDQETSQMLSWSLTGRGGGTPDQSHTILRTARVEKIGDRP